MKNIILFLSLFFVTINVFSQVSPTVLSFKADGGNKTLALDFDENIKWKCMVDNGSFALDKATGKGKSNVVVTCLKNLGKKIDGNITVLYGEENKQVTVKLIQETGIVTKLVLNGVSNKQNINNNKGSFSFHVNKQISIPTSSQNWIYSITYNSEKKQVSIFYKANYNKKERQGIIKIESIDGKSSKTISIVQAGKLVTKDFEISQTELSFNDIGDEKLIFVRNAKNYIYEKIFEDKTNTDWLKIRKNKDTLSITCISNDKEYERICEIIVRSNGINKSCKVIQKAKKVILETVSQNFFTIQSDSDKEYFLSITRPDSIFWEATTDNKWINITEKKAGSLKFQCKNNLTDKERRGIILITFDDNEQSVIDVVQKSNLLVDAKIVQQLKAKIKTLYIFIGIFLFLFIVLLIMFIIILLKYNKLKAQDNTLLDYDTFQNDANLRGFIEEKSKEQKQVEEINQKNIKLIEKNTLLQKKIAEFKN